MTTTDVGDLPAVAMSSNFIHAINLFSLFMWIIHNYLYNPK